MKGTQGTEGSAHSPHAYVKNHALGRGLKVLVLDVTDEVKNINHHPIVGRCGLREAENSDRKG